MNRKENRVMSFRFDEHTLNKIDWLITQENEKLQGFNLKPKTRKEIIEDIVEQYYFDQINKTRDPDVVKRISRIVDDAVEVKMSHINKKIDELLYLAIKADFGHKLLLRSPNMMPSPKDISEAKEIIRERSRWNDALDDFMMSGKIRRSIGEYMSKDKEESE